MKYFVLLIGLFFANGLFAQAPSRVPEPQYIAVDSKDNVYVAVKYGIIRITPDGTLTNLTKGGDLDRTWTKLIIDSKDNLYANDGKLIFKFGFEGGKFVGRMFGGDQWSYKLEDGALATAGFNTIDAMAIDRNDNVYVIDSFGKKRIRSAPFRDRLPITPPHRQNKGPPQLPRHPKDRYERHRHYPQNDRRKIYCAE